MFIFLVVGSFLFQLLLASEALNSPSAFQHFSKMILKVLVFGCLVSVALSASIDCKADQCAKPMKLYEELGCKAVFGTQSCCAKRFECPDFAALDEDKCTFEGKEYKIGEILPRNITSHTKCVETCFCTRQDNEPAKFACTNSDCGIASFKVPGCINLYGDLNECCSTSVVCDDAEKESMATCFVDKEYREGEKFIPSSNPCYECLCHKDFDNSTITSNPHCRKLNCEIDLKYKSFVQRGCLPVFRSDKCCPVDWECPKLTKKIVKRSAQNEEPQTTKPNVFVVTPSKNMEEFLEQVKNSNLPDSPVTTAEPSTSTAPNTVSPLSQDPFLPPGDSSTIPVPLQFDDNKTTTPVAKPELSTESVATTQSFAETTTSEIKAETAKPTVSSTAATTTASTTTEKHADHHKGHSHEDHSSEEGDSDESSKEFFDRSKILPNVESISQTIESTTTIKSSSSEAPTYLPTASPSTTAETISTTTTETTTSTTTTEATSTTAETKTPFSLGSIIEDSISYIARSLGSGSESTTPEAPTTTTATPTTLSSTTTSTTTTEAAPSSVPQTVKPEFFVPAQEIFSPSTTTETPTTLPATEAATTPAETTPLSVPEEIKSVLSTLEERTQPETSTSSESPKPTEGLAQIDKIVEFVNHTISMVIQNDEPKAISKRSVPDVDLIPRYFKHSSVTKGKSCVYNGRSFKLGEVIKTGNDCLKCSCEYAPIGHCVLKEKCNF